MPDKAELSNPCTDEVLGKGSYGTVYRSITGTAGIDVFSFSFHSYILLLANSDIPTFVVKVLNDLNKGMTEVLLLIKVHTVQSYHPNIVQYHSYGRDFELGYS